MIDASLITEANLSQYFRAYEIIEGDAVYNRIIGRSYQINDNVALSDLRYLKVLHYNFDAEVQVGELIVNAQLAENFLNAFKSLYEYQYQIQSMYLIDNYWTGDGHQVIMHQLMSIIHPLFAIELQQTAVIYLNMLMAVP